MNCFPGRDAPHACAGRDPAWILLKPLNAMQCGRNNDLDNSSPPHRELTLRHPIERSGRADSPEALGSLDGGKQGGEVPPAQVLYSMYTHATDYIIRFLWHIIIHPCRSQRQVICLIMVPDSPAANVRNVKQDTFDVVPRPLLLRR